MMNVKTCIVSFPRSGRHLTHKLLASGFGLPLGHMDRANPEAHSRRLVVSHNIQPVLERDGRHSIVMIRDPFEALSSFLKLEWPEDVTVERFKWALQDQNGSNHSTSKSNWINYYRAFTAYHVLSPEYAYLCPRIIIGYKQFMEKPEETIEEMVKFVGGEFDMDAAMNAVGQIAPKHNHFDSPLIEVKPIIEKALQPEIEKLKTKGLI
jgi:hypothetical protein